MECKSFLLSVIYLFVIVMIKFIHLSLVEFILFLKFVNFSVLVFPDIFDLLTKIAHQECYCYNIVFFLFV